MQLAMAKLRAAIEAPEQFKLIAVGDQIQATYTEAFAVEVTPVAKPAK